MIHCIPENVPTVQTHIYRKIHFKQKCAMMMEGEIITNERHWLATVEKLF